MDKTGAERQKRYREAQKALRNGGVTGENVTASVTVEMSETDRLFEADRPGYYIFCAIERTHDKQGDPLRCWKCGKRFTTRLELNKFCSPKCKSAYLNDALHAKEV